MVVHPLANPPRKLQRKGRTPATQPHRSARFYPRGELGILGTFGGNVGQPDSSAVNYRSGTAGLRQLLL